MGRTLFIGDVHGCIEELQALLRECGHRPDDRVVFTGDLVAKGPDSSAVIRLARQLGARSVRGNHEERLLQWRSVRPEDRPSLHFKPWHLDAATSLSDSEWDYLGRMPTWLKLPEEGVLVVHAGVVPGRPVEDQRTKDLLNLRSLTPAGRASHRVEGGEAWARSWSGPETIVFGHDALRGLQVLPNAIGLDTGCVYGGQLTAWLLPERTLVSVPARRRYDPGAR